jgi:cutinase
VDYPADLAGLLPGQTTPQLALGSIDCSSKVARVLSYCPNTRIVISGYSQGAQQARGCLMRLSATQIRSVRVRQLAQNANSAN